MGLGRRGSLCKRVVSTTQHSGHLLKGTTTVAGAEGEEVEFGKIIMKLSKAARCNEKDVLF